MAGETDSRFAHGGDAAPGADRLLPGLQAEERLPWLGSPVDEADFAGIDPRRAWAFVMTGLALLMAIAGGAWWFTHHLRADAPPPDGSLIAAPPGPIKLAPQDPGGKTFDGTGDSSFAVSQGHVPGATLAGSGDQPDDEAAAPPAIAVAAGPAGAGPQGAGIGVEVGAFTTQPAAEAAWAHLAGAYEPLSGAAHRIVQGTADIGTVYRLQAVSGSAGAAIALCDRLKAAGLPCQVMD